MTKRLIIILIAIAVVCGGLIWFNFFRDRMIADFFANQPVPTVTISATGVETSQWHPGIDAIGTVRAAQGVDVASETAGVVRTINFKSNARVEQGDLLVQLNDEVERAQIPGARAAVNAADRQLQRTEELRERGVATQATLDEASNASSAARSELQRLEAVVEQKSIEAPFAGVIGIPRIDVGQYVQPGTVIATLQDLDNMRVDFTVPEQRAAELSIGQQALFGANEGDLSHKGRIIGIDPKIDPQARLMNVRAEIDGGNTELRPGQFIHARVVLPVEDNVIALPQTAVVTSLYGDYVFTLNPLEDDGAGAQGDGGGDAGQAGGADGQDGAQAQEQAGDDKPVFEARQVFVETGRRFGGEIEIVSGLEPGQRVVTSGQNKLQPGARVTVDNSIDPAELARTGRRP